MTRPQKRAECTNGSARGDTLLARPIRHRDRLNRSQGAISVDHVRLDGGPDASLNVQEVSAAARGLIDCAVHARRGGVEEGDRAGLVDAVRADIAAAGV